MDTKIGAVHIVHIVHIVYIVHMASLCLYAIHPYYQCKLADFILA